MRTPLYEHGAQGNCIADFDGDGNKDVLITSIMGNSRGDYDNSFLYFGKPDGSFDIENKIDLPGREAYEQAFADLDDDGDVDILMVNRGEITRLANEVWIYWNDNNQFDTWDMSGLPSYSGIGVQVADLDRNGYLDVIVSNGSPNNIGGDKPEGTFIYWGSAQGWPVIDRTVLPNELTRSCSVCDINSDGILDLIFGNQKKGGLARIYFGNGTRNYNIDNSVELIKSQGSGNPEAADLNKDGLLDIVFAHDKNVLIYYQSAGCKFGEPIAIQVQAKTMTAGDVNNDGWLDLACPFYRGEGKRTWYSTVLLGSEKGYSIDNSLKFPTDGGTGSLICDLNRDGYNDIFFYCHRKDGSYDEIKKYGDHNVNSLVYWGSADGFSDQNVQQLPSVGTHYDMGADIGNTQNRTNKYVYISSPHYIDGKNPASLKWYGNSSILGSIKFQLRVADSETDLKHSAWVGPDGAGSYYNKPYQQIKNFSGDWIQYKAIFDTGNGAASPVLDKVEIEFN